jgi:U3 small nucleolar RNA-associated protein 22
MALTTKPNLLTVHDVKHSTPAFRDALTLLRVWANQRGYGEGSRLCVRGFEGKGFWWGAVLVLLIAGEEPVGSQPGNEMRRKRLGGGLSSYQLFRAALDFLGESFCVDDHNCIEYYTCLTLAKHNFENEPVYLKTIDSHQVNLYLFKSYNMLITY